MRNISRLFSGALLLVCLFFCACTAPVQPAAAEPTPPPRTPRPTAAPTPTPRVGNPVWLFYQDFLPDAEAQFSDLHTALRQDNSAVSIEGALLLNQLENIYTEGMFSFGLLMAADTNTEDSLYASNVDGACQGSGSIATSEDVSSLHFEYTDGTNLIGELQENNLRYTCRGIDWVPRYSLWIDFQNPDWTIIVTHVDGRALGAQYTREGLTLYEFAPYVSFYTGASLDQQDLLAVASRSWKADDGEVVTRTYAPPTFTPRPLPTPTPTPTPTPEPTLEPTPEFLSEDPLTSDLLPEEGAPLLDPAADPRPGPTEN